MHTSSYVCSSPAHKSKEELREEEQELFTELYEKWKGPSKYTDESYKSIPKFYFKVIIPVCYDYKMHNL